MADAEGISRPEQPTGRTLMPPSVWSAFGGPVRAGNGYGIVPRGTTHCTGWLVTSAIRSARWSAVFRGLFEVRRWDSDAGPAAFEPVLTDAVAFCSRVSAS